MTKDKKDNAKQVRFLRVVSIVILVAAAVLFGGYMYQQYKNDLAEAEYAKMREKETKPKEKKEEPVATPLHDFASLKEQNEDVYGWVNVPNTIVDYPVLQTEEDNYYLNHDINHVQTIAGAIYSNQCNSEDMTDGITILYGHDMRADTMFGSLHLFDEETFFQQNEMMTFETADALYTYQIFGVYNYNDNYIPAMFDLKSTDGVQQFLDSLKSCAEEGRSITHVREGVEVTAEDKLLVLSACIGSQSDRRFLVVGKLVDTTSYTK